MITVNGFDLSTIGFTARGRRLPHAPTERTATVPVPGARSAVRMGGVREPGRLSVAGTMVADDHATLLTRLDTLAEQLRGELEVRFSDITDREWVGWLQPGSGPAVVDPPWAARAADVALEILCPDPTARGQSETSASGTSPTLDLGTAPSDLVVTVTNGSSAAITQVILRVRAGGAGGTILRELQWDGSVAVNDALVIDAEFMTVENDGANAIDGLTAASDFPVADPEEGADTLTVSISGGGGESVETAYRKRWW